MEMTFLINLFEGYSQICTNIFKEGTLQKVTKARYGKTNGVPSTRIVCRSVSCRREVLVFSEPHVEVYECRDNFH